MQQTDWTPLEEVYDDLEFLDNENDRPWLLCPECGEWLDRDGCPNCGWIFDEDES